jgi:hypothetical protein
MQRAQVIVYETDGRLETLLRPQVRKQHWWLRPVRHPARVLSLLTHGKSSVVVVKIGRDLEREFAMLEHVQRCFPRAASVVVGDADQPALAGLAWDLGARFVLFPPLPREHLPAIVSSLASGHE